MHEDWKNKEWHKIRGETLFPYRRPWKKRWIAGKQSGLPAHWDEIRRQSNRCTCPMAKHSRGLHPNSIPPRFHHVFDSVGSHIFAVSVRHSAIFVDTRVRNSHTRSHFAAVKASIYLHEVSFFIFTGHLLDKSMINFAACEQFKQFLFSSSPPWYLCVAALYYPPTF